MISGALTTNAVNNGCLSLLDSPGILLSSGTDLICTVIADQSFLKFPFVVQGLSFHEIGLPEMKVQQKCIMRSWNAFTSAIVTHKNLKEFQTLTLTFGMLGLASNALQASWMQASNCPQWNRLVARATKHSSSSGNRSKALNHIECIKSNLEL